MSDTNKQNSEKVNQQYEHERVNYSQNPELRTQTKNKVRDAILTGKERDNYLYIGFDVTENADNSRDIKADTITGIDENFTAELVHLIVKIAKKMKFDSLLFYELIKQR